jgi:hypothetical protein
MSWVIKFHRDFEPEFDALPEEIQNKLFARISLLETFGSELGRPYVDTLNGSQYNNMKELRFKVADGVWRVAFAFDPRRDAILLVAGDKLGSSESRFYKQLIKTADARFEMHLTQLKTQQEEKGE